MTLEVKMISLHGYFHHHRCIQLNLLVPRNSRTRTLQFPFQRHILQLKIGNSSRELGTGKLSLENQEQLKRQQNQHPFLIPGLPLVQLFPHCPQIHTNLKGHIWCTALSFEFLHLTTKRSKLCHTKCTVWSNLLLPTKEQLL